MVSRDPFYRKKRTFIIALLKKALSKMPFIIALLKKRYQSYVKIRITIALLGKALSKMPFIIALF